MLQPFQHRLFASVWSASLVSNLGSLIQVVGASWLMTQLAPSADWVALVQAATAAPIMLLSLAGGATADIWDRRKLMLAAQVGMLVVSAVLAVLAYQGTITPISLLIFTFLLGVGSALHGPAWQSSVGELVPRSELSAAVSLNSVAYNLARTTGPALGGVLVAGAGAKAAFLVNAFSYIGLIGVLLTWRRTVPARTLPPERIGRAMSAGLRYARLSPGIRIVLIRGLVFGVAGSSIWALLPLVAPVKLSGGAGTYGMLFGSLGAGAILGALGAAAARQSRPHEQMVRLATLGFGVGTAITGISSWPVLTILALVLTGACWVAALSTLNFTVQISSPRWVVGRTMATYQMVTFGGMAAGSALWGLYAAHAGLTAALVVAGGMMAASVLLGLPLPLPALQPESLNLDPSRSFAQQEAGAAGLHNEGPVVVTIEYRVSAVDAPAFSSAMCELRRIKRRDGARRWRLMQDAADREVWIERYQSPSWVEHLRRQHRFTVADQEIERRVLSFHRGDRPPVIRHLLEHGPRSSARY
jgi:MFS family permease